MIIHGIGVRDQPTGMRQNTAALALGGGGEDSLWFHRTGTERTAADAGVDGRSGQPRLGYEDIFGVPILPLLLRCFDSLLSHLQLLLLAIQSVLFLNLGGGFQLGRGR